MDNQKTFEEFLDAKYDEINSNSNNMNPEFEAARDRWYSNLDVQELIDYGQEYGEWMNIEGKEEVLNKFQPIIDDLGKLIK